MDSGVVLGLPDLSPSGTANTTTLESILSLVLGGDPMTRQRAAFFEREEGGYIALCPELDTASQGETGGEARANLKEAPELFFEVAPAEEVARRQLGEVIELSPAVATALSSDLDP